MDKSIATKTSTKSQDQPKWQMLTFHCFRKMFLSTSVDAGMLTAGKMLCGKAIPQSDATYLTTVKLREKFSQLKNFLNITELPKFEKENIESLKRAVSKLQEDLSTQTTITRIISEENQEMKKKIKEIYEGLESKMLKVLEFGLSLAKKEDPIAYRNAVTKTLRDFSVQKEENKPMNTDKTE